MPQNIFSDEALPPKTGRLWIRYYNSAKDKQIVPLLVSEWNSKQFKVWLDKYSPDVVVSNSKDRLDLLMELGYRVPADIGYASLDLVEGTPKSSSWKASGATERRPSARI